VVVEESPGPVSREERDARETAAGASAVVVVDVKSQKA